ncbi:LipL32 surface lipoprotein-like protein [Formosa agariphila KMM 3901]|uniref:LipL32 surface lipoprotein-like protein n=1 Tax=Formosa agariphila (strain DSM 15362 / KCTC 12365 / LMG 23005 / KMM 3901 / M-2Alg 35-1) TaxID=1347342 RepID=T2KKC7_FORAG|nr:Lipl32 family lipoprotein [Formosa agariphila]CDF79332.1 LipL32 surface lipoprotein-like protein [Formosa agariphila KMM 3901]
MKIKLLVLSVFAICSVFNAEAQKLNKFGSSIEKKVGPKTIQVPYTDVISYLGYAAAGNEDEVVDGKKFYYIYLWIPAVAPELGVRMLSPVAKTKVKNAIESADYKDNASSSDYFDTYITLERSTIFTKEDISEAAVKSATWTTLASNDDSSEMPKQPSGSSYNSLLRYESEVGNPTKALTVGLYRIGFTTYKTGEVNGTFLAEVAAPVKLPGVVMAKTIEELKKGL